jgi:hypothetical protein
LFFSVLAVLGFWPELLNRTRFPIYGLILGAVCILVEMALLFVILIRSGLQRSGPKTR